MIGHIIAAYELGCRDVRAARPKRIRRESRIFGFYLLGRTDEAARMLEAGRLAQLELEMEAGSGPCGGPAEVPLSV